MCLYPTLIKNRKFVSNKKNGGVIPAVNDSRTLFVPVGCGNCMECRRQYANGWKIRLMEEIKESRNGKFITLTLSDESYKELDREIPESKEVERLTDYGTEFKTIYYEGYKRDNAIIT